MGMTATLGVGYIREVRWREYPNVRREFRLVLGILLGTVAATVLAVLATSRQLPRPEVLGAVALAAWAITSTGGRRAEARLEREMESGELGRLLVDLRAGASDEGAFRRVFATDWNGRHALADDWLAGIDAANGVLEAEDALAKGDPVREFDGTPYLPLLRFALAYGGWLRSEGCSDNDDTNPFTYLLLDTGRLVVAS